MSEAIVDQVTVVPCLRIPCIDDDTAGLLVIDLRDEGVDVSQKGRWVLLPWGGDPCFAYCVAELAVREGYGDDHEIATTVGRTLAELGW